MKLHKGQKKYLNDTFRLKKKINLLTCANRYGKSVLIACIQIHNLFYKLGIKESDGNDSGAWEKTEYRTANLAPHSSNTEAVFKAIHQILTSSFTFPDETGRLVNNKCMIEWFYIREKTLNTPPYKQYFEGNAYIEHRSLGADQGGSIADKPYGLITYDEGGRSNHLEVEVRGVILARLFDWGGPLHIISTPSSESKSSLYYYKLYKDGLAGINNTYTMTGSLKDNTFFSPKEIEGQYELYKDDPLRDQVLEGKFVFGGDTLFDGESIIDAQDESLNDGVRYEQGHKYAMGIDTAIGSDEMVFTLLDITSKPYKLVREVACKGNSKSPQMHLMDLMDLVEAYHKDNNMWILLETWNGESVRFYMDLPPWIQSFTQTYGSWKPNKLTTENNNPMKPRPNNSKKSDILVTLRKLLSARELKIPKNNSKLADQLAIYSEDDSKLQTDRVMALALACHRAKDLELVRTVEWISMEW